MVLDCTDGHLLIGQDTISLHIHLLPKCMLESHHIDVAFSHIDKCNKHICYLTSSIDIMANNYKELHHHHSSCID
jgi:hypothetical protein